MISHQQQAPNKAIILAAGLGTRLKPYTEDKPKPLVEVNGIPILYNALNQLELIGIKHVTIVVGYKKEKIQETYGLKFKDMQIEYIVSDLYEFSGTAYSLWLALKNIEKDVLVLEGDVFFESNILLKLITNKEKGNLAAVASFLPPMSGTTVKTEGENNLIKNFEKNTSVYLPEVYKTINIYLFKENFILQSLLPAMNKAIQQGHISLYLEDILKNLIDDRDAKIKIINCDGAKWYEIDDHNDLLIAEKIFLN